MKLDRVFVQAAKSLGYKEFHKIPQNGDYEIDLPVEDAYPRIYLDDIRSPKYIKVIWRHGYREVKYEWECGAEYTDVTLTVPDIFFPENFIVSMAGRPADDIIEIPGYTFGFIKSAESIRRSMQDNTQDLVLHLNFSENSLINF